MVLPPLLVLACVLLVVVSVSVEVAGVMLGMVVLLLLLLLLLLCVLLLDAVRLWELFVEALFEGWLGAGGMPEAGTLVLRLRFAACCGAVVGMGCCCCCRCWN